MCCGRTSPPAPASPGAAPARQAAPHANTSWTVSMPDGSTRTVRTEIAAKLIVGANPGATYTSS